MSRTAQSDDIDDSAASISGHAPPSNPSVTADDLEASGTVSAYPTQSSAKDASATTTINYPDGWAPSSANTGIYKVAVIIGASVVLAVVILCVIGALVTWRRRVKLAAIRDIEQRRRKERKAGGVESGSEDEGDGDDIDSDDEEHDSHRGGSGSVVVTRDGIIRRRGTASARSRRSIASVNLARDAVEEREREREIEKRQVEDGTAPGKAKAKLAKVATRWKVHVRWMGRRRHGKAGGAGSGVNATTTASGVHPRSASMAALASGSGLSLPRAAPSRSSLSGNLSARHRSGPGLNNTTSDEAPSALSASVAGTSARGTTATRTNGAAVNANPTDATVVVPAQPDPEDGSAYDRPPPEAEVPVRPDLEASTGEALPAYRSRWLRRDQNASVLPDRATEDRMRRRRDEKRPSTPTPNCANGIVTAPGYVPAGGLASAGLNVPEEGEWYTEDGEGYESDRDLADIGDEGEERRRVMLHVGTDDKAALAALVGCASAPEPLMVSERASELALLPAPGDSDAAVPAWQDIEEEYAERLGVGVHVVRVASTTAAEPSEPSPSTPLALAPSPFPAPPAPLPSSSLAYEDFLPVPSPSAPALLDVPDAPYYPSVPTDAGESADALLPSAPPLTILEEAELGLQASASPLALPNNSEEV